MDIEGNDDDRFKDRDDDFEDSYNEDVDEVVDEEDAFNQPLNEREIREYNKVREEVDKVYFHTREDFKTLDKYNKYLERKEEIVYKLICGIDVAEIKAQMRKFKNSSQEQRKEKRHRLSRMPQEDKDALHCRYVFDELKVLHEKAYGRTSISELSEQGKILGEKDLAAEKADGGDIMSLIPAKIAPDYSKIYRTKQISTIEAPNPFRKPELKKVYEHIVSGNIHCDSNNLSPEQKKAAADATGFTMSLVHNRAIIEAYDSLFFSVD